MASSITIKLDGDNAWPDLRNRQERIIHIGNDSHIEVAALAGGMTSGRPSVMFRIDLPDGRVVLAEMSMRNFLMAAQAFAVRYGEETWTDDDE